MAGRSWRLQYPTTCRAWGLAQPFWRSFCGLDPGELPSKKSSLRTPSASAQRVHMMSLDPRWTCHDLPCSCRTSCTYFLAQEEQGCTRYSARQGAHTCYISGATTHGCCRLGDTLACLELREGNEPALRLYNRTGFREVGRRRRYYDNGDAAILMSRML